ncbi:hypothetical protein [Engelhardtia mirabilis]|uniref:Uncharacterized protein n=1 Tax=Engelhardtia mirabilis TaxID=2528011 RepID=A0A518BL33_9BACT|nr:hypothetical protein Pla133_27780 [Planctomycetes bacterium Pla133]QDV02016.1 hypothetical protein Pla86_27770 [Planctomycetes bacterium Pla86]
MATNQEPIKRYDPSLHHIGAGEYVPVMEPCADGGWVEYEEHAPRVAELEADFARMEDAWRKRLERHKGGCSRDTNGDGDCPLHRGGCAAALEAERDELEAERDELLVEVHGSCDVRGLRGERDELAEKLAEWERAAREAWAADEDSPITPKMLEGLVRAGEVEALAKIAPETESGAT